MMRIVTGICTIFILVAMLVPTQAAEVLMVTWRGKTDTDIAFMSRLKKLHPGVKFHFLDADRQKNRLGKLLRDFNMSKIDLVYSYGTTGTTLVKSFLRGTKPLVFNIVSSPVKSRIANSAMKPGNNLTGARLLVDIKTQLNLLARIKKYKTIGIWFDPREKQTKVLVDQMAEVLKEQKKEIHLFRIIPDSGNFDETLKKVSSKTNKLDVLYVPGISSYVKHSKKLFSQLDPKLLVVGGISKFVGVGATVAIAASYKERGRAAAELANKVLSGQPAGEIPISLVTTKSAFLYVDKKLSKTSGLEDLSKLGMNIIEN